MLNMLVYKDLITFAALKLDRKTVWEHIKSYNHLLTGRS